MRTGADRCSAARTFEEDPHWRDHLLFYEYFHGDNGAGIGASHQTGWSGIVGGLVALFGRLDSQEFLDAGWGRRPDGLAG
jgi:hypothetical protein